MESYCFKVALMYDKRTYRHIEMLGKNTFHAFHEIIFDAFDRYDPHAYSFFITRKATKSLKAIYDAPEITHPEMLKMMKRELPPTSKKLYNAQKIHIHAILSG